MESEKIKYSEEFVEIQSNESNDFRAGNYIYYEIIDEGWDENNNRFVYLGRLEPQDICNLSGMGCIDYKIPITEEIFEKCKTFFPLSATISYIEKFKRLHIYWHEHYLLTCEYLHEYQNAHYILTSQELILEK